MLEISSRATKTLSSWIEQVLSSCLTSRSSITVLLKTSLSMWRICSIPQMTLVMTSRWIILERRKLTSVPPSLLRAKRCFPNREGSSSQAVDASYPMTKATWFLPTSLLDQAQHHRTSMACSAQTRNKRTHRAVRWVHSTIKFTVPISHISAEAVRSLDPDSLGPKESIEAASLVAIQNVWAAGSVTKALSILQTCRLECDLSVPALRAPPTGWWIKPRIGLPSQEGSMLITISFNSLIRKVLESRKVRFRARLVASSGTTITT